MQTGDLAAFEYTYSAQGLLTEVRQAGRVAGYGYDARGRLAAVTDPLGRATTYEYDDADRVVK